MCALRDKPRWFMLDGTSRFRRNGQPLHHFLQVAGYATHAVLPEQSVIPIRADAPLDVVCLVSCGVLAGAGPVFNRAKVPPGASVAVWGAGGVGLNTILPGSRSIPRSSCSSACSPARPSAAGTSARTCRC
jgi:Zn-dependent alcohol dehydrogenase